MNPRFSPTPLCRLAAASEVTLCVVWYSEMVMQRLVSEDKLSPEICSSAMRRKRHCLVPAGVRGGGPSAGKSRALATVGQRLRSAPNNPIVCLHVRDHHHHFHATPRANPIGWASCCAYYGRSSWPARARRPRSWHRVMPSRSSSSPIAEPFASGGQPTFRGNNYAAMLCLVTSYCLSPGAHVGRKTACIQARQCSAPWPKSQGDPVRSALDQRAQVPLAFRQLRRS